MKRNNDFKIADEVFEKYLLPIYERYPGNHPHKGQCYHCLNERIEKCVYRLIKDISRAQLNSEEQLIQNDMMDVEPSQQTRDHDYSRMLNELELKNNESGLSDLEEEYNRYREKTKQIFEISKKKMIIKKTISNLIHDSQMDKPFMPFDDSVIPPPSIATTFINTHNLNTIDSTSTCSQNSYIQTGANIKESYYDPHSNYNKYHRNQIPKPIKNNDRLKNTDPFLKNFNPKFLKKENIDKKIFRKFRNYVKDKFEKNANMFYDYDYSFWKKFCDENLLPPMKHNYIEFKSFNTKYFLWLFSQVGTYSLFNMFLEVKGDIVLKSFINEYNLEHSEEDNIIDKLKNYIFQIPKIYTGYNSKADNSTIMDFDDVADTYIATKDRRENTVFNLHFACGTEQRCSNKNYKEDGYNWNEEYCDEGNCVDNVNYLHSFDNVMNLSLESIKSSD